MTIAVALGNGQAPGVGGGGDLTLWTRVIVSHKSEKFLWATG